MTNAGVLTLFDAKDHKYDNSTERDPLPISLFLFLYTKIVKHANLVILKVELNFQE